jgi:hypothetical protein
MLCLLKDPAACSLSAYSQICCSLSSQQSIASGTAAAELSHLSYNQILHQKLSTSCCLWTAACSLYHSLSNVYCPVLGIEQQGSAGHARKQQQHAAVDPRLQELILHVQAGLGKALRGADAAQVGLLCQQQCGPAGRPAAAA